MGSMNPKVTKVAINALGGAMVTILGTIMSSRVEIMEDPSFNAGALQGLTGFLMDPLSKAAPVVDPNCPNQLVWLPNGTGGTGFAFEPIRFGGDGGRVDGGLGNYVGADGVPYVKLTSNGLAGGILLVEWP